MPAHLLLPRPAPVRLGSRATMHDGRMREWKPLRCTPKPRRLHFGRSGCLHPVRLGRQRICLRCLTGFVRAPAAAKTSSSTGMITTRWRKSADRAGPNSSLTVARRQNLHRQGRRHTLHRVPDDSSKDPPAANPKALMIPGWTSSLAISSESPRGHWLFEAGWPSEAFPRAKAGRFCGGRESITASLR